MGDTCKQFVGAADTCERPADRSKAPCLAPVVWVERVPASIEMSAHDRSHRPTTHTRMLASHQIVIHCLKHPIATATAGSQLRGSPVTILLVTHLPLFWHTASTARVLTLRSTDSTRPIAAKQQEKTAQILVEKSLCACLCEAAL